MLVNLHFKNLTKIPGKCKANTDRNCTNMLCGWDKPLLKKKINTALKANY